VHRQVAIRRRSGVIAATLTSAVLAGAIFAGAAQAVFSVTPTGTVPIGKPTAYGPGFDGTFWTVSGSSVGHIDDEGNNLGDGFTYSYGTPFPLDAAYFGGRVYITLGSGGAKMIGVNTGGSHDILIPDSETNSRMGGNQKALRTFSNGTAALAFGQDNKIGMLNLSDGSSTHPWYPQTFMGSGINKTYNPAGNDFETCSVGPGAVGGEAGEPTKCGTFSGYYIPNTHENGFNYPNDIAFGPQGGIFVSEYLSHRVSRVNNTSQPGGVLDLRFGQGPGSAAGQLESPQSIVVQPGTANLLVSEAGNRRISVFNTAGGYIASFGYGVLNGADEMQVCGVDIGKCQAGIDYKVDSRSYFTQLDFGPDGQLYAYMPIAGQIQVFGVSGGVNPEGPPPGGPGLPGTTSNEREKIRLAAAPLKVAKGKKTKLTATVNAGKSCAKRIVLFQEKVPRSWNNLGRAVKAGKGCKATKKVKITAKSVFRAVLIDSSNQATLAHSPNVTVKLK
jgi:hypothetical protein